MARARHYKHRMKRNVLYNLSTLMNVRARQLALEAARADGLSLVLRELLQQKQKQHGDSEDDEDDDDAYDQEYEREKQQQQQQLDTPTPPDIPTDLEADHDDPAAAQAEHEILLRTSAALYARDTLWPAIEPGVARATSTKKALNAMQRRTELLLKELAADRPDFRWGAAEAIRCNPSLTSPLDLTSATAALARAPQQQLNTPVISSLKQLRSMELHANVSQICPPPTRPRHQHVADCLLLHLMGTPVSPVCGPPEPPK